MLDGSGSGKSASYSIPNAYQMLGSYVFTDPKGELYNNHSIQLREEGYRIIVIDLRNPYSSTRWNPMDNQFMMYKRNTEYGMRMFILRYDYNSNL